MTSKRFDILIVDDEESIRFAFQTILKQEGFFVRVASDLPTARVEVETCTPDLIITDILLKGKTGIDLLEFVRERQLNCPVMTITGEPSIDTAAKAVRLGAFDYILKPIRKKDLLQKVKKGVRHKLFLDEQLRLERENTTARKNMEAVFKNLQEGLLTVDSTMRVVGGNPAFEHICGVLPEQIKGKKLEDLAWGCSRACHKVISRVLDTRETVAGVQVECLHQKVAGQVVCVTGTPLVTEGDASQGVLLILTNSMRQTSPENRLTRGDAYYNVIGKTPRMREIFNLIECLREIDTTVLITGETGTGKEMVANAIHQSSIRRDKPFIKVNCSALSENLLESELFGHVRGAFTGAIYDKKGRFEAANGGTLFLDEIGDMSAVLQLKLLRVLQEKVFERVGCTKSIKSDVRIIAAAGNDFKRKVKQGQFRTDLYYRIKVVDIQLPPLHQRRDDIPLLAEHFMTQFNQRFKKKISSFSTRVMTALMAHNWPGNIRELEHAIEHAFVLCQGDTILLKHLPPELWQGIPGEDSGNEPVKASLLDPDSMLAVLEQTDWNKAKAARLLGIGRRTLYRKIEKWGLVQS